MSLLSGALELDFDGIDTARDPSSVREITESVPGAADEIIARPPVTREELAQLQVGDKVFSKSGTIRTVQAIVGKTILFQIQKDFYGSHLDQAFMNRNGEHLRKQDYDSLELGDIVYSLDRNMPHVILEVHRNNDPAGSSFRFVSGISMLSTEMAADFVENARIDWVSHIEKALPV